MTALRAQGGVGVGPLRPPVAVSAACLLAVSINAVLIQTIVVDVDSPLKTAVRLGVLGLAVLALITYRIPAPGWLVLALLGSTTLFLVRDNPDQLSLVFVLVLAPILATVPERRLLGIAALVSLAGLALIFVFLALGLTHNEIRSVELVGGVERARASFGTLGVPFFFNVVYGAAALSILYAWKYQPLRRWLLVAGSLSGATYFFLETDARGGYGALLLFVGLLWLVPASRNIAFAREIVALLPIIFLGAAVLVARLAGNWRVDLFLSSRPRLYESFLQNISFNDVVLSTSVKQFDQRVASIFAVDNSYLHLLVGTGIVSYIGFAVLYARAIHALYLQNRWAEIAFLIATLTYCTSEGILLRVENVFIIYAWYLVLTFGGLSRSRAVGHQPSRPQMPTDGTTRPAGRPSMP